MEAIENNEEEDDYINDSSYEEQVITVDLKMERTREMVSPLQFLMNNPSEHEVFFGSDRYDTLANELFEGLGELKSVAELHRKRMMEGNTNSPSDGVDVSR